MQINCFMMFVFIVKASYLFIGHYKCYILHTRKFALEATMFERSWVLENKSNG